MKVVLLNPPYKEKFIRESRCQHSAAIWQTVYPPLTLGYMAGVLRDEHEVKVIDAIGEDKCNEKVADEISNFNPELVIASTSSPTIESDLLALSKFKELGDFKVGIFGVHATYFSNKLIGHPAVDYVIRGEPELTVHELSSGSELCDVKGITYKNNGKIASNQDRPLADLNALPYPAWDMVDIDRYKIPIKNKKYVLFATGRGCPSQCIFCVSPFYYGRKFRLRTVENVVDELRYVKSMGIDDVFFFTDTFTLNKRFVLDLCDEMIKEKLNISWICNSRVDTVNREMLQKMAKAGCWLVSFGIESGSQRILDGAKKGIKLSDSTKTIRMAREAGIMTAGHFIFGLPGETNETIDKTIAFAQKSDLDLAEFYIATPFPGSSLYETLSKNGALNDVGWSDYGYSSAVFGTGLDLESKRKQAYRKFYLRPKTIFNLLDEFNLKDLPRLALSGMRFMTSI